jgi:hypothetical protein
MAVLLAVVAVVAALYAVLYIALRPRLQRGEPPLVSGPIPWLGAALSMKKDPIGFMARLHKRFASGFVLHAGGKVITVLTSPAGVNIFYKVACHRWEIGRCGWVGVMGARVRVHWLDSQSLSRFLTSLPPTGGA